MTMISTIGAKTAYLPDDPPSNAHGSSIFKTIYHPIPHPHFPSFPALEVNVNFWTDIFTLYDHTQGVVHDKGDLERIYTIIPLDPSQTRASRKKNRKTMKAAFKRYKAILADLARGNAQKTPEHRRVASLFPGPTPPGAFKKAAKRIRCQTGLKSRFKKGLIRSGAMLDEFKRIFALHGLPQDLVYLPCVESLYNPKAHSRSGAKGVWQFTRYTGKLFMRVDHLVDERKDPFASAHAAAKLLKLNYDALGSWPLAITAYNHGLNGMRRAKAQKGDYEGIFSSYKSRYFGFASRNFYAEFLAARRVAKGAETYFGKIAPHAPTPVNKVILTSYLPVRALKKAFKLSHADIQDLNPALDTRIFTGEKYIPRGYALNLPHHISQEKVENRLKPHYQSKQRPSKFHRVQKGDTATAIARANGISLARLKQANNLNRRGFIRVGQTLRIPKLPPRLKPKVQPKNRSRVRSGMGTDKDQLTDARPAPPDNES